MKAVPEIKNGIWLNAGSILFRPIPITLLLLGLYTAYIEKRGILGYVLWGGVLLLAGLWMDNRPAIKEKMAEKLK